MAKKKYKNIKVEQDELKPIAIGEFENRKKTSIGIFIILTIFVLVVIFLPEISSIVNEYLNPTPIVKPTPTPDDPDDSKEPEDPDQNVDEEFYAYVENLKIEREEVIVSDIKIDAINNTLTYNVTNNTNNYQDIEELNYYIEIYNTERTLLERVKLVNEGVLAAGAFKAYTKNISSSTSQAIGYIVLVQKTEEDYPAITLTEDTEGNANLVCKNNHETITYNFKNSKLQGLTSAVQYLTTDLDYENIYNNYQSLVNNYNTTKGITSTIFNNTSGFNITTIVDLEEASRTYIFNADTFKLDTDPKVVSFEMEAQGFDCN